MDNPTIAIDPTVYNDDVLAAHAKAAAAGIYIEGVTFSEEYGIEFGAFSFEPSLEVWLERAAGPGDIVIWERIANEWYDELIK